MALNLSTDCYTIACEYVLDRLGHVMLTLSYPRPEAIGAFLASQQPLSLTYPTEGMTRGTAPPGYNVDHRRERIGAGPEAFAAATAALRAWAMFRQSWVWLHPADRPPAPGDVVAIVARTGLAWWTNACRVLYVIDEAAPIRRYGFAYGTLPGHAEQGEERFLVEQSADGGVWYDLLAYSRPRHWLARLGYPVSRAIQHRFASGSIAAMKRAIAASAAIGSPPANAVDS